MSTWKDLSPIQQSIVLDLLTDEIETADRAVAAAIQADNKEGKDRWHARRLALHAASVVLTKAAQ